MRFSLNLIQQGTKIISNTHEWFSAQYDTQTFLGNYFLFFFPSKDNTS